MLAGSRDNNYNWEILFTFFERWDWVEYNFNVTKNNEINSQLRKSLQILNYLILNIISNKGMFGYAYCVLKRIKPQ